MIREIIIHWKKERKRGGGRGRDGILKARQKRYQK